ncbi:type IIL restriction-modification enzyme MmeI [Streptomyces sp. NPDC102360]|uniref:type IIL restriction-modification enzyme MmeI n=1 Tax=Streptomyces sp. NPDC102360 TaxID=3366160 RepID=UPI00382B5A81
MQKCLKTLRTKHRLVANSGKSFQGSIVLGKGFVLTPDQAEDLIQRDPRNKDVLFPYLNGEDLNSRPDCSASRWVINFHDWPEERAREYPEPFAIIERDVKPERMKVKHSKNARARWWLYERSRPELYKRISRQERVLVVALVSRTVMPARVSSNQVLAHKLAVFTRSLDRDLALLSSSFHSCWAWKNSSTLKADLNYSPSDVFETLPHPDGSGEMDTQGATLACMRTEIMADRKIGLTKLYSAFHDPRITDEEIKSLRSVHAEIDQAVAPAYGWNDLDMKHSFNETRQGVRFCLPRLTQTEITDRLLDLNHAVQRTEELPGIV